MPLWNRQKPKAPAPPPVPAVPELDELARLLPERDDKGRFFWQDYVERLTDRFDGLPAPDGGESFVRTCLGAGCKAVPVIEQTRLWEMEAPPSMHPWRPAFERRIRLGLFFAASLRCLVRGLCRLQVRAGNRDWHVLEEQRLSYREFVQAQQDGMETRISWLESSPRRGQVYVLAAFFFQRREILMLTHKLAAEVLDYAGPDDPGKIPGGLFGRMLSHAGQVAGDKADVAGLFLEALRQLVHSGRLRVNTRPGDLFVTPEVSFLVAPGAVDVLIGVLRRRGHSFTRPAIYQALGDAGCLVGIGPGAKRHTPLAKLKSPAWRMPIEVRGLSIAHAALWRLQAAPAFFDGTIKVEG